MLKMTLIWRMIYREKIYSFRYKQLKEVTISFLYNCLASQVALVVKSLPTSAGDVRDVGSIPGPRRSLEKGMATHSSILAWRILWTEEPGGPRFIGPHRTWLKQLSTAPILSFTFSELLSQTPLSWSFSYLLAVLSESPWLDHLSHHLLFASTSLKHLIGTRKALSLDHHSTITSFKSFLSWHPFFSFFFN